MRKKRFISSLIRPWLSAQRLPHFLLRPSLYLSSGLYQLDIGVTSLCPCASSPSFPQTMSSSFLYFPLSLPITLISFIQSVPLIGSLIFAFTRTFDIKIWQRIHCFFFFFLFKFSLSGSFICTKSTYILNSGPRPTLGWGFTCLTKDLFIQFLTNIY